MTSFEKLAELGITFDPDDNQPVSTTVEIRDVDELRWLLDMGLDDHDRLAHFEALFGATGAGEGLNDQVIRDIAAYTVGDAPLSESARAALAPAFPLRINVTADPQPITVSAKKDLTSSDGTPSIAVFSDVTMLPGGYFSCVASTLIFTCDTFARAKPIGSEYDFAIVGKVGSKPTKPGTPGAAGQAGSGGPGECSSGGIAGHGGGQGTPGATGTTGTDANRGGRGTPSQAATIWIKKSISAPQLVVYTQSGPGGQGGDGGDGGKGQQGGNGGNGVRCGCTGNAGGSGAAGGRGGKGGRAGDGGDGVDAIGNITVYVPTAAALGKVEPVKVGAPPGEPGAPGAGGGGGDGGSGGSAGKHNDAGSSAGAGGPGDPGNRGNAGDVTGKPADVVPMLHP